MFRRHVNSFVYVTDSINGELIATVNGFSQMLNYIPRVATIWQEMCYDICQNAVPDDLVLQFTARNVEAGIDNVHLSEYMCTGKGTVFTCRNKWKVTYQ